MNIKELKEKLKTFNLYLTDKEIADCWGIDKSAFSRKQKFGSEIKLKHIEQLQHKYNISLINNQLRNNTINILPVCASCGNGITIDTSLIDKYDINSQYSMVVAKGTSMTPTISNEDICVIKKFDGNFIDGIYCFSFENDMYIKRLSKNLNQLICTSDNPEFEKIVLKGDELDKINIYGRVVTVIRKF